MFDNIISGEEHIEVIKNSFEEDIFETMFYVIYGDTTHESISIEDIHKKDAINKEGVCCIKAGGVEYFIEWEDGNWNGSQILSIDTELIIPERFVSVFYLYPKNPTSFALKKWKAIKDQSWFVEMERNISYDFHFSPTEKIRSYWREKADSIGAEIRSKTIQIN